MPGMNWQRWRSTGNDLRDGQTRPFKARAQLQHAGKGALTVRGARSGLRLVDMTVISVQTAGLQTVGFGNQPVKPSGFVSWHDTGAVHAAVDVEQYRKRAANSTSRSAEQAD